MNKRRKKREVLPVLRLEPGARLPTRAHADDAGLDLYATKTLDFRPGQGGLVATGVAVAVPPGHVGMIADRSSLAKKGLKTAGGIIDAGYRGEVGVLLWNISKETFTLRKGDRVAQLLVVPIAVPEVRERKRLGRTGRGQGGFGSSGR